MQLIGKKQLIIELYCHNISVALGGYWCGLSVHVTADDLRYNQYRSLEIHVIYITNIL